MTCFPRTCQLCNWLNRYQTARRRAAAEAPSRVTPVRLALAEWPQTPCDEVAALYVLPGYVGSSEEVFVAFSCAGMRNTLLRCSVAELALVVDVKMGVLERGMGVATVSLMAKTGLRRTVFRRGPASTGARVQGLAHTSRAFPILQATMHSETAENYRRLFLATAQIWREMRPADPPLAEVLRQVHKDFAPGSERARQDVFPNARPCDDFVHLRRKERDLAARCVKGLIRSGRVVKTHFDWVRSTLDVLHLAPTLDVFDAAWRGFLARLVSEGEHGLVEYLRGHYTAEILAAFARDVYRVRVRSSQRDAGLLFASFWCGIFGILPGTGSGSHAAEALHSAWQRACTHEPEEAA